MKYAFIQSECSVYAVSRLCRVLDVCRSAYYEWLRSGPSAHQQKDDRLAEKIKISHQNSRENYGSRRIQDDLKDEGETVSKARVLRLMKQEGLQSKHRKRFKATTN